MLPVSYAYVNVRYMYNSAYVRRSLCISFKNAGDTLLYADTSISCVTSGISYEQITHKLDTHSMLVSHTLCISSERGFL